ncbi:MAG: sterol desaturase family protein [Anaerolineales bacterium]|nr:sterol desaturase family protein [Anaerolineales bacterium]
MHYPIDHSDQPIRLFKSDFLEFFTHISPVTVTVIWLPVIVFFLWRAVALNPYAGFPWQIPASFLAGLFLWTFAEYNLHRFVFHFRPRAPWQERIIYLLHGIHHHQPQCKTRLVMPPVVSIPLAVVFYGLFYLVFGLLLTAPHWVDGLAAGFTLGYLIYDLIHYATHHFPMKRGVFKFLRRYHMLHHFKTPEQRFGVSSPLWDVVYRTMPSS